MSAFEQATHPFHSSFSLSNRLLCFFDSHGKFQGEYRYYPLNTVLPPKQLNFAEKIPLRKSKHLGGECGEGNCFKLVLYFGPLGLVGCIPKVKKENTERL